MAHILLIMKILPTDIEIDLDNIINKIKLFSSDHILLRNHTKEPLAFGIYYVKAEFVLEEKDNIVDELENSVKSIPGVSELEVMKLSRLSVNI